MTSEFANAFAKEWIADWNSHDLEKVLSHYSEDFSIESPMAIKFFPGSEGRVSGKENVRKYWKTALETVPDLKFEILDLLTGVNGLSVYYINTATYKKSVEVMKFNSDNKVETVIVHYSE